MDDFRELAHTRYQALRERLPELFETNYGVEYVTDPAEIAAWEAKTNECIGVLSEGKYELQVFDLIRKNGELKSHARTIAPYGGVIIIVRVGDKFVFEDQYRPTCCKKFLAFPRGHRESNADPESDARREVEEELGGAKIGELHYLGRTYPETNMNSWFCSVWEGEVSADEVKLDKGFEGIENLVFLTAEEIDDKIAAGEITCGYTLAAWALYKA